MRSCADPAPALTSTQVVSYDVPWLSPLVPWQPAEEPVQIGSPPSVAAAQQRQQEQQEEQQEQQQELQDEEERPGQQQQEEQQQEQGTAGSSRRLAAAAAAKARARVPPPPPPGPPPTPPGAEATALLAALDEKLNGLGYPRHVCIQVRTWVSGATMRDGWLCHTGVGCKFRQLLATTSQQHVAASADHAHATHFARRASWRTAGATTPLPLRPSGAWGGWVFSKGCQ